MPKNRYYNTGREEEQGRDGLFAWTIAVLLLVGVAFASWIFSFYVFGHPEKPFAYSFLKKIGKLEPQKRFEITAAPRGEFLTVQKLYERFSGMPDFELKSENEMFFRGYLRNYSDKSFKLPYVTGTFSIMDAYPLTPKDVFPTGVAVLAQSADFPAVLIEHIYPTDAENVETLQKMLVTGLDLRLRRTYDLSTVIRVTKLDDGRLLLTLVPLSYGSYTFGESGSVLRLEPPQFLNMQGGWPVLASEKIQKANEKYFTYRRNAGLPEVPETPPPSIASAELSSPTEPSIAAATPAPEEAIVPVATPIPVATPLENPIEEAPEIAEAQIPAESVPAVEAPVAVATPELPVAKAIPANTQEIPKPVSTPIATAQSPAPPHTGVTLKPFLQSEPVESQKPKETGTNTGKSWTVYRPGAVPRGRLIGARQAVSLADKGTTGERLYLDGQYAVTASGGNRVVMRPKDTSLLPGRSHVRVIVEYPQGSEIPREGSDIFRGETRPFEIREIRRGADGEINIYAREITQP